MSVLISPQGMPGANGIVGDLAWNTGAVLLAANENLGGFAVSKGFTASPDASLAIAQIAPTLLATFQINSFQNDVTTNIGTVTFQPGATVGVVAFLPGLSLILAGAVICLVAPSAPDATLALVSVTIASL